jgi:hypothetical protein
MNHGFPKNNRGLTNYRDSLVPNQNLNNFQHSLIVDKPPVLWARSQQFGQACNDNKKLVN